MPDAVERPPRYDDTAADIASLVKLGREEPQPVPQAPPELPPPTPPADPVPDPVDEAEMMQLSVALTEAGIVPAVEDQDAVKELAKLDAKTVAVVQGWLKKKGKPESPGQSK